MKFRFVQLKKSISFILAAALVLSIADTGAYAGYLDVNNNFSLESDISGDDYSLKSDLSGTDSEMGDVSFSDVTNNEYEEIEVTEEVDMESLLEPLRAVLAERTRLSVIYPGDTIIKDSELKDSANILNLSLGSTFYVEGVELVSSELKYYGYAFDNGREVYGYVSADSIIFTDEEWTEEVNKLVEALSDAGIFIAGMADASSDIEKFPSSYRDALTNLKKEHSNWMFVPDNTGLDFTDAVNNEMGDKSWIQATTFNSQHGFVGSSTGQSGWYYATKAGVEYYMDPRNFLTEDRIFMFEQLTFNSSYQTQAAIQTFLGSSFMAGEIPGEGKTYSKAFYEIGKSRGISPIHLASLVRQEQGSGGSALISGTYPGYEGYYNYFNVGASGHSTTEVIINGLKYAQNAGWNTRYKSLEGGSGTVGNGYILRGQDTMYYEKFNVAPGAASATYTHQYMQNIQAPLSQASSTRNMYANSECLNSPFVFKIPVFDKMPEALSVSVSAPVTTIRTPDSVVTDTKGLTSKDKKSNVSSVQLTAKFTPEGNLKKDSVKYSSSDKNVATVDSKGKVSAVGPGTATITVAAKDNGKGDTHSSTIKIKVIKPITDISSNETYIILRRPDTVVEDDSVLPEEDRLNNISTYSLEIDINPADTADKKTLTYSSSDKSIVKVNSDGKITAVKKGTATITVKASETSTEYKPSIKITVQVIAPVTGVTLTNPTGESVLLQGSSTRLLASITPKDATGDKEIHWESSDESVLTVDSNGNIAAIGEGTATITVSSYLYSDSLTFTVTTPKIEFYDETGETVLIDSEVIYGEPISEALYEEALELYTSGLSEDEIFLGMYSLPGGAGIRFTEETVISEAVTRIYPLYCLKDTEFFVVPLGDYEYTGSKIKPQVVVYANVPVVTGEGVTYEPEVLELNKDYKVSYSNNTKVNTNPKKQPVVTVTGKGNFSGTVKAYFNIVPAELNGATVQISDVTAQYTGKTIKSSVTVYRNGKKLKKDTDYKLTYPSTLEGAYKAPGSWPVVVTGKGAFSGTVTCNEIITSDVLLSKAKLSGVKNQSYTPGGATTTFTLKYGKTCLEEGVHYTSVYTDNTKIGTARVTLTAVPGSGFRGTRSFTFKITGTSISKARIIDSDGKNPIKSKTYTGNEEDVKQSGCELWLGQDYLVESTNGTDGDYIVKYSGISKAGTAKITFTGINYYKGSVTKSYKISPKKLGTVWTPEGGVSGNELLPTTPSYTFLKGGVKPVPIVTDGEKVLVKGTDYTISWSNYSAVVTSQTTLKKLPCYTIKGKGNYSGTIKGYYNITDGCLNDESKISVTVSDAVYLKKAGGVLQTPVLKDSDGKKLVKGKDFKVFSYIYRDDVSVNDKKGNIIVRRAGDTVNKSTDIIPAGTRLRVTVTGIGNYKGSGNETRYTDYKVVAASLSKASVKVTSKQYYDYGRPVTLTGSDLKVTYGGVELVEGLDYYIDTTSYIKNTNVGKATVTLRAIDDNPNFGGSKNVTFTINKKKLSLLPF